MDINDLPMEVDWERMGMLSSINSSLLNNPPAYAPQQPSVQDSVGTVATPNQAQNIELSSFGFPEEATASSMGNLSQLVADYRSDQLPQLSQHSFGPFLDETQSGYYIPSMVGVIPEGGGSSSIQSQLEMKPMDYYNQFSLLQDNNVAMMHNMSQQNEYNSNNHMMMMMPDNLENLNFNGMSNQQPSSYPCIVQQNPVMSGNMNTNGHFMTDQTTPFSAINNHAINPCNVWHSQGEQTEGNGYNPLWDTAGFQQQSSTMNDPTNVNSGFAISSEMNSTFLGLPGSGVNEGSISQLFNMEAPQMETLFRPESAPVVQPLQVPPLSSAVNTITPLIADSGLPISPSLGAQPSVPIQNVMNQNDISTVTSYGGPYATLQQNPTVNPTYERPQQEPPRRGRPRKQFEPGSVTAPLRRRKRGSSSSAKGKARKTPASQANNDAAPPLRKVDAPLYDKKFEKAGFHRDPLLRLFKLEVQKSAKLEEAKKSAELEEAKKSAELTATTTPISVELAATTAPSFAELTTIN